MSDLLTRGIAGLLFVIFYFLFSMKSLNPLTGGGFFKSFGIMILGTAGLTLVKFSLLSL